MNEKLLPYAESDESFDAFVVQPSGAGPHPLVLVCHAWGRRDAFAEDKARELAKMGYIGAAIDLYGVGKRGHDKLSSERLMMSLVSNPALLRRRLQVAHDAVRAIDGVDPARVGSIGFCFGGLCAILMARMGLPLRGVASFHGLLKVGEQLEHDVRARILVLHGQDDPMVPSADVAAFAEEMKRVHADWRLHVFPNTVHAFTNPAANDPDLGTVYNEEASHRSWAEMKVFLTTCLANPANRQHPTSQACKVEHRRECSADSFDTRAKTTPTLRHLSRDLPLRISIRPFCQGLLPILLGVLALSSCATTIPPASPLRRYRGCVCAA